MNNGARMPKVILNIESQHSFSASTAAMRISPVTGLNISMPARISGRLEISIVGRAGELEFLKRCDFVKESLDGDNFNLKGGTSVSVRFDFDDFEYDYAFLSGLEDEAKGEIFALVKYDGMEYMTKADINLLAVNVWAGLEGEPSVISAFVNTDENSIHRICDGIVPEGKINYSSPSKKNYMTAVKSLYKRLKNCNIIYTRPAGYGAGFKQRIRSADELFSSANILATPLEIALCFCACAERIGFDTSLLFVRGKKGDISVLCSVYLTESPVDVPVCEDAAKIKKLVDNGDMIIIDPSVFAAAQNTSFVMAIENTAESFIQAYSSLVCLVDIKKAKRLQGVAFENEQATDKNARSSIGLVYSSLMSKPVMQYLSGHKRVDVEEIPLLVCDFGKTFCDTDTAFRLLPLDIGTSLDDFAPVDKDFSSIVTMSSPRAKQHFSSDELTKLTGRFNAFKERINSDGDITTALRDEDLYNVSCEMAFGKNKKEPYFAFGYVKITDKLSELVTFAPICLVKCDFTYEKGNFYAKQVGNPIVNKVFIRNALKDASLGYDSFMKALMPTDKKEIFDLFENIRMALSETDDRYIYEIVKETHIVNVEIDDYALWTSLATLRKQLCDNKIVKNIFENIQTPEKLQKEYVPALPLYSRQMRAVINEESGLVEGCFTENKEQVLISKVLKNITEAKSSLIVTDDEEMSMYVKSLLSKENLCDLTYCVPNDLSAYDCASKISEAIEKYKDTEGGACGFTAKDLFEADKTLVDYTERLNSPHKMGLSLKQAVKVYLSAGEGIENCDELYVSPGIFEGANEDKIDSIFVLAGNLIASARKLCKSSGLEKYTPIKNHPLYRTRPEKALSETDRQSVRVAIDTAIPVLSEYRDTFMDVCEILGLDEKNINSLYKLEMLNDLYKLVLSARDVDIPEKFIESDIESFAMDKRFENETKKRMQAIEFKLPFFSKELFEDIENVIRGNEHEQEEDAGFLRRLMSKKHSQDKLLQYVENGRRNEFSQQRIAEVYKLLYEYKDLYVSLRSSGMQKDADEETNRLGKVSEKAAYFAAEICSSESERKKLLSGIFRLISVIPVDAALARNITLSRARLAELYSEQAGALGVISSKMGLVLDDLVFETGLLSFDGLSKYLEEIKDKLSVIELWCDWLTLCDDVNKVLPEFVSYLEAHGAAGNVDRIFARSILCPVAEIITKEKLEGLGKKNLGRAKEKYVDLLMRACEMSYNNAFEGYKNVMKHVSQTYEIDKSRYVNTKMYDFTCSKLSLMQKVFPVVIVTKNDLPRAFGANAMFDNVIVLDNAGNGYSMLVSLCFGGCATVFNMSKSERSVFAQRFAQSYPVFCVDDLCDNKDMALIGMLNCEMKGNTVCVNPCEPSAELVRMNGSYDRTNTRTNKTETELALVKATSLLQNPDMKVAITAFTKEQCSAMEKLLCVLCKKNKILEGAKKENRIHICTPDRLYMKDYNALVVSTCFGSDKESRIGWDFGYGSVKNANVLPEGYLAICDRTTVKTYILSSLNAKDLSIVKKSGCNAMLFGSLCDVLCDGRIGMRMKNISGGFDDGILPEIMAQTEKGKGKMSLCEGKMPVSFALLGEGDNKVYALVDNEKGVTMHDELIVKRKLESTGSLVVTIEHSEFAGEAAKETIKSLA